MSQQQIAKPAVQTGPAVPAYAWTILAVAFIAGVAAPLNQFKVSPVMPVLMETFQISIGAAGWLMSVFAVTGFLLAIPAGLVVQKLGLKATGLIAMGALVIGSVLGAISTSAGLMMFSRVIEGVGMGLIAVVSPTAIAMWFPREKQGTPMGIWATWVPVGAILMFILAPAMASAFGWRSVWWFGTAFALLAFVLVWLFLRLPPQLEQVKGAGGPPGEAPNLMKALSNRSIWLLAAMFGFFNMATMSISTFYPTFLSQVREYSMANASFVTSLTMITILFSAPLGGWLSDKLGSRKALFTWPFIVTAILFLLPFTVTGTMIPLMMILMGVLGGMIPTATFAAAPEIMGKPQLAGIGLGAVGTGQNLGMFIGPALFGGLVASFGWPAAGYWMIPVLALGFLAGWLVKVR